MDISLTGHNLEIDAALREYVDKKVSKLERFFERPVTAEVVLQSIREIRIADVTIQVGRLLLRGEGKTDDMYVSVNRAVDAIERQVRKFKTRINRRLKRNQQVILDTIEEGGSTEDEETEEPRIVKVKRFPFKPMAVEEAIMQMELLGHDFFVFMNAESQMVNVVYRRRDGDLGLIEPDM